MLAVFTNVTSTALPGIPTLLDTATAWGDYNNDGKIDLMVSGLGAGSTAYTQLWKNNGGTFTDVTSLAFGGSLPQVYAGTLSWADYDNDGKIDLLITGSTVSQTRITQLWKNNGDGTFTNVTSTAFPGGAPPGIYQSAAAWGDFNKDGYLDFALAGGFITQLWQNNGNGTFTNVTSTAFPSGLTQVTWASVAWGDYNKDTYPDLLLTGSSLAGGITQLWANNGNGTFSNVTSSAFSSAPPGLFLGSATWADYNNDGYQDLLLTGNTNTSTPTLFTLLYKNNGNGTFANVTGTAFPSSAPPGVYDSSVAWADYNRDGKVDFLLTGYWVNNGFEDNTTQLWQNTGNGTFTNVNSTAFPSGSPIGLASGSVAWADYNNDSTLDFFMIGTTHAVGTIAQLWQNNSILGPAPSVTTNPTNQTVNPGQPVSFTAAASGSPFPTVQWDVSTNGGASYSPISGATTTTFSLGATSVSQNGNLYEAVFTNSAGSATTTAATLDVQFGLSVTLNPANQTVNLGQAVTFTAAATGNPNPTVKWEVSTNNGASYSAVSGATSSTFTFTPLASQNGNLYEAVFSNSIGSVTTSPGTLSVQTRPIVSTNPVNQTKTAGQAVTFTAAASGTPTPNVQWDVSTDGGTSYNPISGATSTTLTFTTAANQNRNRYEAVFSNGAGSATTTAATLTVQSAPAVTTNPANQTVNLGQAVTFTAADTGNPNPGVQWKVSTNGATYTNIFGANSTTLSFTAAVGQNGNRYEAVFSNTLGSATTTPATLILQGSPTVTMNPVNQTVNAGQRVTFNAAAAGNPTVTVKWEFSSNGGASYSVISGATSTSFTIGAAAVSQNGTLYEAVFSNSSGSTTTTAASLNVQLAPSVTTNPTDQIVPEGQAVTFTAAASIGNPIPTVQWEVSSDGGANYSAIAGATSTTLAFNAIALQNGNLFEAVFSNVVGSATTTPAKLTALSGTYAPVVVVSPTNQIVPTGQAATFTAVAFSSPTETVQWLMSTDNGLSFTPISGATSTTLTFSTAVGQNNNLYEAVFSNALGSSSTTPATLTVLTGSFTNVTSTAVAGIPGVLSGAGAWADYNNDGKLDFLLTGYYVPSSGYTYITQLWQNNGNGTFTNVTSTAFPLGDLPALADSSVAWGDYNNDGYLDFFLTGFDLSNNYYSQLWQNNGNGTFTNVTSTAFPGAAPPGLIYASIAWGDYNNDGHLDLLLGGQLPSTGSPIQLWKNNGNGTFTDVTSAAFPSGNLAGVAAAPSAFAWGDFNHDGYLDFLLFGISGGFVSQLWQNNGNGTFTNVTASAFPNGSPPGVYTPAVAWGDYNNDGNLDFIFDGQSLSGSGGNITQLWKNNGNGTFTNVTSTAFPVAAPPGLFYSSIAWGDYNNDGQLDITLAGYYNAFNAVTLLYQNNGNGTFTDATSAALPGVIGLSGPGGPSEAWGDYNNDGKLDLLLTGASPNPITQLWQNTTSASDTTPSAPTNLRSMINGNSVALSWNAPTGAETTPSGGLAYELRVGTTPGGTDVVSPRALSNGFVTVPQNGSLVHKLSYLLQGLQTGQTFYWSVQAVDNSLAGSPFAATVSFAVPFGIPVTATSPTNQTAVAGNSATFTAAATGTPNPAVQWEVSSNGGASYSPVPGATSTTFMIGATSASQNGNLYEAVFNNSVGSTTTTTASLNVQFGSAVTLNPTNQVTNAGLSVTFTAAATGNPVPTVQWKVSSNHGASYASISGATATTLTIGSASASQNGNLYEAVFNNAVGSATTTAAMLTLQTPPAITISPTNQTVIVGQATTFTAAAAGTPSPTVQWQVSADNGASYSPVAGATSTTLTFTPAVNQSGYLYEAVFSNVGGNATTSAATLTVEPLPNSTALILPTY